jgi:hypothetical protein
VEIKYVYKVLVKNIKKRELGVEEKKKVQWFSEDYVKCEGLNWLRKM